MSIYNSMLCLPCSSGSIFILINFKCHSAMSTWCLSLVPLCPFFIFLINLNGAVVGFCPHPPHRKRWGKWQDRELLKYGPTQRFFYKMVNDQGVPSCRRARRMLEGQLLGLAKAVLGIDKCLHESGVAMGSATTGSPMPLRRHGGHTAVSGDLRGPEIGSPSRRLSP